MSSSSSSAVEGVRLRNALIPSCYDLEVSIDLASWRYSAIENITFEPNQGANDGCDTKDLDKNKVTLHCGPEIVLGKIVGAVVESRSGEHITFVLSPQTTDEQTSSTSSITIHFTSVLHDDLRGFYRSTFTTPTADGGGVEEHRVASTHFEPSSARRCYICLDEPAARATFRLTVRLPIASKHFTVLSNSPVKSVSEEESSSSSSVEIVHRFHDIENVPPYLTAIVVGEFECLETMVGDVPVRFFTVLGKKSRAKFGLEAAAFSLKYFQDFFKSKFPLTKLDLVALPDFPIGGMENWGCITLIENVLVDEATNGLASLKSASNLICHEVSHNWFGNLVGISWWEGLWLKEGFASWAGYHGTSKLRPTWMSHIEVTREIVDALDTDAHDASHPVEVPIVDPADVTQVFDSISYCKGMGVVNMVEDYLGPDLFSAGLAHYINRHQFSNTKTDELWESLGEVSKLPLSEIMASFTKQQGFPLVKIEGLNSNSTDSSNPVVVNITQERFRNNQGVGNADGDDASDLRAKLNAQLWSIPLKFVNAKGETFSHVLSQRSESVELPQNFSTTCSSSSSDSWVKANPNHTGFFRCVYPQQTEFAVLLKNFHSMGEHDRRGFQNDVFAVFATAMENDGSSGSSSAGNCYTLADVVALIDAIQEERSYTVLVDFAANLKELCGNLAGGSEADEQQQNRERDLLVAELFQRGAAVFTKIAASELAAPSQDDEGKMRRRLGLHMAFKLIAKNQKTSSSTSADDEHPLVKYAVARSEKYAASSAPQDEEDPNTLPDCVVAALTLQKSADARMATLDALWAKYRNCCGGDADASRALLAAICEGAEEKRAEQVALSCLEQKDGAVRAQFGGAIFMALSRNPAFVPKLWPFFQQHFAHIDKLWGGGQFRIQVIAWSVGSTLTGAAMAADFTSFFKTHPLPNATLSIRRAAEGMRTREVLRKIHSIDVVRAAIRKKRTQEKCHTCQLKIYIG